MKRLYFIFLKPSWRYALLFKVFFSAALHIAWAEQDTSMQRIEGRKNSTQAMDAPYLIIVSGDGFRYDYPSTFATPTLDSLEKEGVRASYLIPSFPSVTFPNYYAIATGMYPAHHGIVNNQFWEKRSQQMFAMSSKDSIWYKGKPIWALAEENQMLSAAMFWVGSEVQQSVRPTYFYWYHNQFSPKEKVDKAVGWLRLPDSVRPHLIMLYFPEPDGSGHRTGVQSEQTRQAVQGIDSILQYLVTAVRNTGLNKVHFIFLADHGMLNVDTVHTIPPPAYDENAFIAVNSLFMFQLYAKDSSAIVPFYDSLRQHSDDRYQVYMKRNMPSYLHSGAIDDRYERVADISLLARAPYMFDKAGVKIIGKHGYDPKITPEMNTVFYAWGPYFYKNLHIPAFENIHVYPVAARLLGLPLPDTIDGNTEVARRIIKKTKRK